MQAQQGLTWQQQWQQQRRLRMSTTGRRSWAGARLCLRMFPCTGRTGSRKQAQLQQQQLQEQQSVVSRLPMLQLQQKLHRAQLLKQG